jgi:hypothetical protein
MTVDKLLEQFVLNKYTGLEKPGNYFEYFFYIVLTCSSQYAINLLTTKLLQKSIEPIW